MSDHSDDLLVGLLSDDRKDEKNNVCRRARKLIDHRDLWKLAGTAAIRARFSLPL